MVRVLRCPFGLSGLHRLLKNLSSLTANSLVSWIQDYTCIACHKPDSIWILGCMLFSSIVHLWACTHALWAARIPCSYRSWLASSVTSTWQAAILKQLGQNAEANGTAEDSFDDIFSHLRCEVKFHPFPEPMLLVQFLFSRQTIAGMYRQLFLRRCSELFPTNVSRVLFSRCLRLRIRRMQQSRTVVLEWLVFEIFSVFKSALQEMLWRFSSWKKNQRSQLPRMEVETALLTGDENVVLHFQARRHQLRTSRCHHVLNDPLCSHPSWNLFHPVQITTAVNRYSYTPVQPSKVQRCVQLNHTTRSYWTSSTA